MTPSSTRAPIPLFCRIRLCFPSCLCFLCFLFAWFFFFVFDCFLLVCFLERDPGSGFRANPSYLLGEKGWHLRVTKTDDVLLLNMVLEGGGSSQVVVVCCCCCCCTIQLHLPCSTPRPFVTEPPFRRREVAIEEKCGGASADARERNSRE